MLTIKPLVWVLLTLTISIPLTPAGPVAPVAPCAPVSHGKTFG